MALSQTAALVSTSKTYHIWRLVQNPQSLLSFYFPEHLDMTLSCSNLNGKSANFQRGNKSVPYKEKRIMLISQLGNISQSNRCQMWCKVSISAGVSSYRTYFHPQLWRWPFCPEFGHASRWCGCRAGTPWSVCGWAGPSLRPASSHTG